MTEDSSASIGAALQSAQTILVVSHYNPDADAYGSSLGLALALEAQGKQVRVVNESGTLSRFSFFPSFHRIEKTFGNDPFDTVIVCDCGDVKRVGDSLVSALRKHPCVINIDHHISNERFGRFNFVRTDASSTCELILDILRDLGVPISPEVGTCLLAGIMSDTGSFRYSSVTPKTFRDAAFLMERGASPSQIADTMYSSTPLATVRLHSEALRSVQILCGGRFAEITIPASLFHSLGATPEDSEGLVEKARDIEGVEVAASLRQDGHLWRVSLRSVRPELNVSTIASSFGGGGHVQAAAFRSSQPLETIQAKLREAIERLFV